MTDSGKNTSLPTIAIVGRPNVGKSSLFNAVVGRRLAIVHEMSGVTRDRVAVDVEKNGRKFRLIDTGGLGLMDGENKGGEVWDVGITAQAKAAIAEADLLIMVADAQVGITPLDRDVAMRIRRSGRPVLFAANKCDDDKAKLGAAEFASLGFGEIYPISCTHRGGIGALLAAALAKLPEREAENVITKRINLAVVGRPNVGKSSLVNALVGEERVMTGPIAGTTRDAVDIEINLPSKNGEIPVLLVDTAGLRKRSKVDTVVELFSVMRAKSAIERADVVLFVVEASPDGMTAQDRKIAGIIQQSSKPCVIVANKCDLQKNIKSAELEKELRRTLPGLGYAPVALISAEKRSNLDKIVSLVNSVSQQSKIEVSTGVLNRVLTEAFESNPPPIVGTAPLKLFYAVASCTKPHVFKLFVNRKELAQDNYLNFLKKKLRDNFGLTQVPIVLEVVSRPKKVEGIRHKSVKKTAKNKSKERRK